MHEHCGMPKGTRRESSSKTTRPIAIVVTQIYLSEGNRKLVDLKAYSNETVELLTTIAKIL